MSGLYSVRSIRIYHKNSCQIGEKITLSKDASLHLIQVLRSSKGTKVTLFCGDNYEYYGEIISPHKNKTTIEIKAKSFISRESDCQIHLAQSVSKGYRMEWVIQKSVELGVTEFTPVISARSVVRLDIERFEKKIEHWQRLIIASCAQCGRNFIPKINPIAKLDDFINFCNIDNKIVLHPKGENFLYDSRLQAKKFALLIGPEGGLTDEEIIAASEKGFTCKKLGKRILRTETAGMAAIACIQTLYGDFSQ